MGNERGYVTVDSITNGIRLLDMGWVSWLLLKYCWWRVVEMNRDYID